MMSTTKPTKTTCVRMTRMTPDSRTNHNPLTQSHSNNMSSSRTLLAGPGTGTILDAGIGIGIGCWALIFPFLCLRSSDVSSRSGTNLSSAPLIVAALAAPLSPLAARLGLGATGARS